MIQIGLHYDVVIAYDDWIPESKSSLGWVGLFPHYWHAESGREEIAVSQVIELVQREPVNGSPRCTDLFYAMLSFSNILSTQRTYFQLNQSINESINPSILTVRYLVLEIPQIWTGTRVRAISVLMKELQGPTRFRPLKPFIPYHCITQTQLEGILETISTLEKRFYYKHVE